MLGRIGATLVAGVGAWLIALWGEPPRAYVAAVLWCGLVLALWSFKHD